MLLVNALVFSFLGGALLTRYLLPMYPLVLFLAVSVLYRRVPYWYGLTLLSAFAFFAALFINPPYGFAPEDNLSYVRVVRMHQAGIAELTKLCPAATVLTAWPMTDELTHPELGYVKEPWDVFPVDDFTADQIARASQEPEKYSAALVFSTKDEPPSPFLNLGGEKLDERYFGLHHDLLARPDCTRAQWNAGLAPRRPQSLDRSDPFQSSRRSASRLWRFAELMSCN